MGHDTSPMDLLLMCRDYYLASSAGFPTRSTAILDKLQKSLTGVLGAMSSLHQHLYPGWEADPEIPGYLVKVDPPMSMRVPYHILPVFPTGDALNELWLLSRALRSTSSSAICLSGSNAVRALFDIVNDVDFCEYVPISAPRVEHNFFRTVDGDDYFQCLRIASGVGRWDFPWGAKRPDPDVLFSSLDPQRENFATCKFDLVAQRSKEEIMEVSNLVIACDAEGRSAAIQRTFAAQEATLGSLDWVPNNFGNVIEMGRYIDWLLTQMRKYFAAGDHAKCLKRCGSISRVLFLPDVTKRIIGLAKRTSALQRNKVASLQALRVRLQDCKSPELDRFLEALATQITREQQAATGNRDENPEDFNLAVLSIVNHIQLLVTPLPGPIVAPTMH